MLAAVGPLLGDGPLGAYHFESGQNQLLAYRDGEARLDDRAMAAPLGLPYRLRRPNPPVAVLTSRLTASAAEEVAVAFAGRPGTRRFGEPTRGVPTLNQGVDLPSGARLWITTATVTDRDGRSYAGPIPPDNPVRTDWSDFAGGADPVLSAAQNWLAGAPACRQA